MCFCIAASLVCCAAYCLTCGSLRASHTLHSELLSDVLHLPVQSQKIDARWLLQAFTQVSGEDSVEQRSKHINWKYWFLQVAGQHCCALRELHIVLYNKQANMIENQLKSDFIPFQQHQTILTVSHVGSGYASGWWRAAQTFTQLVKESFGHIEHHHFDQLHHACFQPSCVPADNSLLPYSGTSVSHEYLIWSFLHKQITM